MECKICKKDHTKKNEGPLTKCELNAYFSMGAKSSHMEKQTVYAFGAGNRFQFPGAR